MKKNVFPVRFYCSDKYGWADCPALAKMVWLRIRKDHPTKSWYGTDMQVESPNRITLYVYEIEDSFLGGIGQKIFETVVTKFTEEETKLLSEVVLHIYTDAATDEWERREVDKRVAEITKIRKEIFGV